LLFYKLKRDGLILHNIPGRRYFLSPKGQKKWQSLSAQIERLKEFNSDNYHREKSKELMIVIFDIPEHERRKRVWLRSVLKNLGFKMVQKSVWIGHCQIPEIFLKDIQRLRLARYIEIFKATKYGSLE
jgi:DNA-binding transcriptional regulator PaaX